MEKKSNRKFNNTIFSKTKLTCYHKSILVKKLDIFFPRIFSNNSENTGSKEIRQRA